MPVADPHQPSATAVAGDDSHTLPADRPGQLHTTAWLLVAAAMFAMLGPVVVLRGMSLDGVTYAAIARNMAEGLGDADGVAALGEGRYLVSEWPGLMHVVAADGTHATIMDTRAERRFLNDFLLAGETLYQPHWEPSEMSAYQVAR